MLEKLAKQTAIYGISTIVVRFLNYLLTPYYTRIFEQGEYGIVTDIYALIPFALVLLSMGMESSFFRFTTRAEEAGGDVREGKRRVFASTWGMTSLNAIIFFILIALFNAPLSRVMGEVYVIHPEYIMFVAAIVMVDVWSIIPFSKLREQGRALHFVFLKAVSVLLNVTLAIGFGVAGLYSTHFGVGWVLVANLVASIVTLLLLLPTTERIRPRIDWSLMRQIFLYSLPLFLGGLAGTATEFIDRQMIKFLAPSDNSMAELGIYGAIVKIAVVMTLFTQMYRLAAEPFFLSNFRKEEFKDMNAAALKYFVMASMFIFLIIALYRDLFALIVGANFRKEIHILPVVLGANILSGVWLNLSFWYKREEKTKFALWITLTGLVCSVGFGALLIPKLGYYGAAWSRFAAEVVMVAVSIVLNRIYYPTPYKFGRMVEYIALALAIFFVSEQFDVVNEMLHYTLSTLFIVLYLAYAVWREKIDLRAMFNHILRRGKR